MSAKPLRFIFAFLECPLRRLQPASLERFPNRLAFFLRQQRFFKKTRLMIPYRFVVVLTMGPQSASFF